MTDRTSLIAACVLFMLSSISFAEVTAEKTDRGVAIKIDGELFTEYLTKAGQSPAMWPIIGPTGQEMTRAFPLRPAGTGKVDTTDHPHHQSLWFTHDQVNDGYFWHDNVNEGTKVDGDHPKGPKAHIDHREFAKVKSNGTTAKVVTRNDWMVGDKRVLEDKRKIVYGMRENGDRWIDFTITLEATDGDVTFGDTKEGAFAIRVPDAMRLEAKLGGQVVNSEGQTDDAAWGLPAKWVDYTGPTTVDANNPDDMVGIAIFSHPTSFRPTPRWHVRGYGLFTANPFGQTDFPNPEAADQKTVTLKKGDSLTFRYLVLLHRGRTEAADIEAAFEEFVAR